jgi:hypothetical protein
LLIGSIVRIAARETVKPNKRDSVVLLRKRTIPTERPPHVGEVSANF